MLPSLDRLQAIRDCCQDEAAFERLQQLLATELRPPQSDLLQGVAEATSQLLTSSSFRSGIQAALTTLGRVTGVDRVYIFEAHPHPETPDPAISQRFEWVREGVSPQIDNPALQNYTCFNGILHRWYETLTQGQSFSILTRDLSPPERALLVVQDIQSLLIVPILIDGTLWGLIGFDDCHTDRQWSRDEEAALLLIAASLGGAIARQQTERALRLSKERYQAMLDASPDLMFRLSPAGQYLDCKGNSDAEVDRSEVVGRYLADLLPADVAALSFRAIQQTLATGELQTCEYQLPSAKGLRDYEARIVVCGEAEVLAIVQDVTDRKQVEATIRSSEARNRALLDAIPDLMFRIRRDGTYLDCKAEHDSDILLPPSRLIGKTVYQVLPPELAQQRMHYVEQALQTGAMQHFEYQLRLPRDRASAAAAPLRDFEARVVVSGEDEVLAIVRDITDRKQSEAALRLSEEKFSKAFRSSPNPMSIASLEGGRLIEVNDSFLQAIGYERDEVIGRTVHELKMWANPADRPRMTQILREQGKLRNFECQFRHRSGRIFTTLFSAEVIQIGGELCLIDVAVDITDRLRTEQQLWAAAERDRLLGEIALRIRQSLDIAQILDTTVEEVRHFLRADRVFIGLDDRELGLRQVLAESVDPRWTAFVGRLNPTDEHLQEIRALFAQDRTLVVPDTSQFTDYPIIAAHYAEYDVKAVLGVPLTLNHQMLGLLVVHQCSVPRHWEAFEVHFLERLATQVTIAIQQAQLYRQVQDLNTGLERQVAERTAQLRQKMEELQELNALKDEFLNAFSHDLRTPVMGISLVINNLLSQSGDPIPVARSILERMVQSSDHQLQLLNSLLQAYSSERQGVILHYELVQLSLLTQVIVEELEPLVAKNQATFDNHVPPDLPLVKADPTQLRRVFENLITNALHHNPPGVHLVLDAAVEEEMIRFTLHDDGIGMQPELCDRLFDRYARGRTSRHSTGIGLGLYLCRQIITAHGGQIGVHSQPGQGSRFWLTLPLAIPSVAQPNAATLADA